MESESMGQELIKCSCCDKLVPANDIELTFHRPDVIAAMDEEEREEKCKYNDDIYVCKGEYFYIRCVLPLPVHDKGQDYCLGVWAQVSENSFQRIWDLWDEEEQVDEPPMKGLLANTIPLTEGSFNAEIEVQLTGPTSRPKIIFVDKNSSLYQEQTCGIPIHRASEYSDLCR